MKKRSQPYALADVVLGWSLVIAAVALSVWKCRFGLDLTDEGFYLAPAWKLYSLGDKPFLDEVYNGPRQSDLLNYFFVRPWVPFSILWIRVAATLCYALTLFAAIWTIFRRNSFVFCGAIFYVALVFDVFNMPTWSYNWWARDLVLVNAGALWAAHRAKSFRSQSFSLVLAGIAMGTAAVAHNGFLLVSIGSSVLIFFMRNHLGFGSVWWIYGAANFAPILIDVAYLLSPAVREGWLESLRLHTMVQKFEGSRFSITKFTRLAWAVVSIPEFWLVGFLTFALWFQEKFERWNKALLVLVSLYVAYRLVKVPSFNPVQGTYHRLVLAHLGVAFGAAMAVVVLAWREQAVRPFAVLALIGLASALVMGLTSVNQAIAMIWCVPVLMVVAGGAVTQVFPQAVPTIRVCVTGIVVYLLILTTWFATRTTYYDVSPREAIFTAKTPPFDGLRTSPRRGFLLERLAEVVSGKKFVLAYVFLPGVFLLDDVRSSSDTLIISHENSREMTVGFLQRMLGRGRLPEVIIETSYSPWTWGLEDRGLYFQSPIRYAPDDAFVAFRKCATLRPIASFLEFSAYSVDPDKVRACVPSR